MALSPQAREAQRVYNRRWRAKNPEKVRRTQERYWARLAERMAAEGGDCDGTTVDPEAEPERPAQSR